MFNFFKSNSKLGIDIGTASIKVIEFTKRAGRFALSNYGLFEFKGFSDTKDKTETIGPDKNILKLPDQEIIWGLKEVLKKSRIKSSDQFKKLYFCFAMSFFAARNAASFTPGSNGFTGLTPSNFKSRISRAVFSSVSPSVFAFSKQ